MVKVSSITIDFCQALLQRCGLLIIYRNGTIVFLQIQFPCHIIQLNYAFIAGSQIQIQISAVAVGISYNLQSLFRYLSRPAGFKIAVFKILLSPDEICQQFFRAFCLFLAAEAYH